MVFYLITASTCKKQMQPLKASGRVEKGVIETIAPCLSTDAPEVLCINSHH